MSSIRPVAQAEPITPTSTVFATPDSTLRGSPPINANSVSPTLQSAQSRPRSMVSPPPGREAGQPHSPPPRSTISPVHQVPSRRAHSKSTTQHQPRSASISAPPPLGANPALSFDPAHVTSQPVSSGVVDILLPTAPPVTIRAYACSPDICVIDYPPKCNRDEAIIVASTLHDDALRATLAVAAVVGDYAPHLADKLIPQPEKLPSPNGRREVINPRHGRGQFEHRAAPLPELARRGTDTYAVQWKSGPKPFVMDFKGQNVGMDPATGEEDREMLSMLVVVLRQAVAAGELEAGGSSRSSDEHGKEKIKEKAGKEKKERNDDVGNSCKCVVM